MVNKLIYMPFPHWVPKELLARKKPVLVIITAIIFTLITIYLHENSPYRHQIREYSNEDYHPCKNITLDDIFISVKTATFYEKTRLPLILKTWFQLAKNQTWFFTDTVNEALQNYTNGHMIETFCSKESRRKNLCCKTALAFDAFLKSRKKWFCHFDDDVYVNVPRLVRVLQKYDYEQQWYLGRNVYEEPVTAQRKAPRQRSIWYRVPKPVVGSFWYATFGAGVCISTAMALQMAPFAYNGKFIEVCEEIGCEDEVTMGYIIEHVMKKHLTIVPEFHSHLEPLRIIPAAKFNNQITFSYQAHNVIGILGFQNKEDPTRMLSLHCFLFPHLKFCLQNHNKRLATFLRNQRRRRRTKTTPMTSNSSGDMRKYE